MGPFGKLGGRLKSQQKETQKNHNQGPDARVAVQDQTLFEITQVSGSTKVELLSQGHMRPPKGSATEEKTCLIERGILNQIGFSSPVVSCEVPDMAVGRRQIVSHAVSIKGKESSLHKAAVDDVKLKRSWREDNVSPNTSKSSELIPSIPSFLKKEGSKAGGKCRSTADGPPEVPEVSSLSQDFHASSLALFSRGLNPIKTRSGPLYSDGLADESQLILSEVKSSSGVEVCTQGIYGSQEMNNNSRKKDDMNLQDQETTLATSHYLGPSSKNSEVRVKQTSKADMRKCQKGVSSKRPSESVGSTSLALLVKKDEEISKRNNFFTKERPEISGIPDKEGPSSISSIRDTNLNAAFETEDGSKQLDVIKEMETAPMFHSVTPAFELYASKKWPKDIKSLSHELGPKGGRAYDVSRPHSDNDLEELLAALRARFNTAKEEVDADLNLFAADLVEILDRNFDSFPQWRENMEDLLLLARKCTLLSATDFRRECESIVRDLDEQRQELPTGLLKQLYTRMLFILTRCTRLLQFQQEASPAEEGLHKIQQCLKGVPSVERTLKYTGKMGKHAAISKKLLPEVLEHSARNDIGMAKVKISKQPWRPRLGIDKAKAKNEHLGSTISSKVVKPHGDLASGMLEERWEHDDGEVILSPSLQGPNQWMDAVREEQEWVICRICEEEVLTSLLERHSTRCTLADYCDVQGLNPDEHIRVLAENLELIAELNMSKSNQTAADDSPDRRSFRLSCHEGFDSSSPQSNEHLGKTSEARYDNVCISECASIEDMRGPSLINFKHHLRYKSSDQGVASSSAGSGTPRSALTTPRTSQLDLLHSERNSFGELEDAAQISELAEIARCIAAKSLLEEDALEMLGSYLEELHELLARNKVEALTVDTFGRRIEKLLREKIYMISGADCHRKTDSMGGSLDDDGMSLDEGAHSFKSTATHSSHGDKISIEDFEILKLVSRGAFGRVFLARKRTTGDLFAIKVLRKIDMIRKNAVENILAERDILISVCNPFVVRFYYSFTCRENLYLVMEYLNGGDLYSLLRYLGCLSEEVARVYIAELVLALEYLHSLCVVHRDLKPDNILIARDGHIKLTDFGLSKVGLINSTDDLGGPAVSTPVIMDDIYGNDWEHAIQREHRKERSAVGTPDYLAPEILLGTEHGYTADWWSVGVILFECLTGRPPFNAEHPQIIFDNILNRNIPWLSIPEEMSYEAKDLIDKLLTEDPNERLGANGASEVKSHGFFKNISWDSLARQKAAFVPSPESVEDTSYFTSRYLEAYTHGSPGFGDSSDCSTSCSSSNSLRLIMNEGDDEFGELAEFERSPAVEQTFNNFSFKNLSQLVSMNYDLLSQTGRDSKGHSRNQSAS